ncbi:MAG TPA: hypothetical protein VE988_30635 [Gemmataceae bacterium]|nr:hypothetical protein [Gemmataceae bacterium]
MANPTWFKLLKSWTGEGLTLQFVVGALAMHEGRIATLEDAEHVLNEIAANRVGGSTVEARWCYEKLEAPVLCLIDSPTESTGLIFHPDLRKKWNMTDPVQLRQKLLRCAEGPINNGNFSREPGLGRPQDSPFSPDDVGFIRRALQ